MLLAVLLTAGSAVLLVALGWITDQLLGDDAERWARQITADQEERRP